MDEILIQDVYRALKDVSFLSTVPLVSNLDDFKFVNHRETYSNIKVFNTAVMLYKKNILSLKEIREGVKAFTLIEKEDPKGENILLNNETIQKAFRVGSWKVNLNSWRIRR